MTGADIFRRPKRKGPAVIPPRSVFSGYLISGGGYNLMPPWSKLAIVVHENAMGAVYVVELRPALFEGWIFERVTHQDQDDWPGMSAEAIDEYINSHWFTDTTNRQRLLDPEDPILEKALAWCDQALAAAAANSC